MCQIIESFDKKESNKGITYKLWERHVGKKLTV